LSWTGNVNIRVFFLFVYLSNVAFNSSSSTKEVQWALEVFWGHIESQKQGRGAWKLNGCMIDAPVVKAATALLDRARACGIDVDTRIARCKVGSLEKKTNRSL
jgi:citrate lyase subunit beta-like protein